VEHHPLSAQGNVVAAAALSRSTRENRADYYVFYGCCGTVDSKLVGQVFRAAQVSYLSLGVVVASPDGEVVKLQNKWIVRTQPDEQAPLDAIELGGGSAGAPGSAWGLGVPDAHVLATDKVIKVSPGVAPVPIDTPPSGPIYAKGDWTYSLALALYSGMATKPVLVDMESFGIASAMRALGLCERVVVLRVVTDALSDKAGQRDQDQLDFLRAGLAELAAAIATILGI
jgi:nucleoside phosphorylase